MSTTPSVKCYKLNSICVLKCKLVILYFQMGYYYKTDKLLLVDSPESSTITGAAASVPFAVNGDPTGFNNVQFLIPHDLKFILRDRSSLLT